MDDIILSMNLKRTSILEELLMNLEDDVEEFKNNPLRIDDFSETQFQQKFRFYKPEFMELLSLCQFPEKVILENGSVCQPEEILMIVLRRLCYPARLVDLQDELKKSKTTLSRAFKYGIGFLYRKFDHLLDIDTRTIHERFNFEEFSQAISDAGSAIENIVGFIDGTKKRVCIPSRNQESFYSGHVKFHCIKYQCITFPNGLIGYLHGPWNGRRHDAGMLNESGIIDTLHEHFEVNSNRYFLYADPGYSQNPLMFTLYSRNNHLSFAQQQFNKKMSRVRISIEWGFGKVCSIFAFLEFHKNLKIRLQPIGIYYRVACILANCHTCAYGSIVSDYFGLESPSMREYLSH